jgi:hypothetical protein
LGSGVEGARPTAENGKNSATPSAAELGRRAALEKLNAVLDPLCLHAGINHDAVMKSVDQIRSPENIAALMAPKDEESMLTHRVEDSRLRHLWRLTSILMKLEKGALTITDSTD